MSETQREAGAGRLAWLMARPARLFVSVVAVVVVLDQWTKWLAVAHLTHAFDVGRDGTQALGFLARLDRFLWLRHPLRAPDSVLIEGFWRFRYAENPGAAWSILSGSAEWFRVPFFLTIALAAMVFIVYYYRRTSPTQPLLRIALPLVFSGALGNFLDRVRLGYVIDFIEWHWHEAASWPIFNVADSAISIGVGLMLLDMLLQPKPEKKS